MVCCYLKSSVHSKHFSQIKLLKRNLALLKRLQQHTCNYNRMNKIIIKNRFYYEVKILKLPLSSHNLYALMISCLFSEYLTLKLYQELLQWLQYYSVCLNIMLPFLK